jgi:N-acetylglutamate synthase-like GNAT family acetyltransferase
MMSGEVFRITELNPRLEMEVGRLLGAGELGRRFTAECDLFGIFDPDGSLAGIAGCMEIEKECLLQFVMVREAERGEGIGTALVSRILARSSDGCDGAWVFATPGSEGYFARFGFEEAATDRIPARMRAALDRMGIEIASTRVMTVRLPENWQTA